MLLKGSCHCKAVKFSVDAYAPVPYMHCHCSICRKTNGGGGSAINLGAHADSLKVEGGEMLSTYQVVKDGEKSPAERKFCASCGSALWVWDSRWPKLVHPFASAIDTPLPSPPENVHIMLGSKPDWVAVDSSDDKNCFDEYPLESLEAWHRRHNLYSE